MTLDQVLWILGTILCYAAVSEVFPGHRNYQYVIFAVLWPGVVVFFTATYFYYCIVGVDDE